MGIVKTAGGYDLGEVISALQKTIRRGEEAQALYWALELLPHFRGYLWKRLIVIAHEDIGVSNFSAIMFAETCKQHFEFFWAEKKEGPCRLTLANCLLVLCRSKKTRIGNHLQCVVNQERLQKGMTIDIPDYALDKHTARGKGLKRSWKHFFEEGGKLEPKSDIRDPYEEEAEKLWMSGAKDNGWFSKAAKK